MSLCGVLACVTGPGALPVSHCHADRPSVHTHYVLLTVRVTVPATSITQLRLIAYTLHRLCPSPGGGGGGGRGDHVGFSELPIFTVTDILA